MQTDQNRQQVVAAIEARREAIVDRVMVEMYADPFWEERFGEHGKRHARQDAHYHLDNLVTAVRMDLITSPYHHYRWLQNVLVLRGMCSRHIRQTIDSLDRSLAGALPEHYAVIAPYLEAGYRGLDYEHPACRALAGQEAAIAQEVVERLESAAAGGGPAGSQVLLDDVLTLLSYLQDSAGKDAPRIFVDFVRWRAESSASGGIPAAHLKQQVALLATALGRSLDPDHAGAFRAALEQASRVLAGYP